MKIPSKTIMSSYFQTREVTPDPNPGRVNTQSPQQQMLRDIEKSDIIILEMVAYNLTARLTYGFADYFLQHPTSDLVDWNKLFFDIQNLPKIYFTFNSIKWMIYSKIARTLII